MTAPTVVSMQSYRVQFSTQELPACAHKHTHTHNNLPLVPRSVVKQNSIFFCSHSEKICRAIITGESAGDVSAGATADLRVGGGHVRLVLQHTR